MTLDIRDAGAVLRPDPTRTQARFFLPGESTPGAMSRTARVVARLHAVPKEHIEDTARGIARDDSRRHDDLGVLLTQNGGKVGSDLRASSADRTVFGAVFTAESAIEGAALCNPSVVVHPDQSGLAPGAHRAIVSLRSIGEGHVSTISFCSVTIGPGRAWSFDDRGGPVARAAGSSAEWERDDLGRALQHDGTVEQVAYAVLQRLPPRLRESDVDRVVAGLPGEFFARPDSREVVEQIRRVVRSDYGTRFAPDTALGQRVLTPRVDEERHGMEDARFVRFTERDGAVDYRATYTAYDGRTIVSRLLVTTDFESFSSRRMLGPASSGKGMAFFPRRVGGRLLSLTRSDGESISLAASSDGREWRDETVIYAPRRLWEIVQSGNCGSPIETEAGWLVLTHGVGPMRKYSIGAILLDLDDPRRVLRVLDSPLIEPSADDRDGYVPNVVYSCGSLLLEGTLWIPYGVADQSVKVASVPLDELLGAMAPRSP